MKFSSVPQIADQFSGVGSAVSFPAAVQMVKQESNPMSASDSTAGISPTAKRKMVDNPDEEADDGGAETRKRSRGRPRVNTRDETAAERRRTQIRLAQRAYRSRKDSAITSLEQKVKELEQIQRDTAMQLEGLFNVVSQDPGKATPEFAHQIKDLIHKLSTPPASKEADALVSSKVYNGSPSPSPNPSPDANPPRDIQSEDLACGTCTAPQLAQVKQTLFESASQSSSDAHEISTRVPTSSSATSFVQADFFPRQSVEVITYPTHDNASFPMTNFMGSPLDCGFANTITDPSPYLSLGIQDTLAHYETTFGRRFQRSAQEAGYRLVTSPSPPRQRYYQVFGFCLRYETPNDIGTRLLSIIKRQAKDTLDYWDAPFVHLGGSGTVYNTNQNFATEPLSTPNGHFAFPIGNQTANALRKPQHGTGFSMGPFNAQIEALKEEKLDSSMYIKEPGFEGQFYDPDEVERYLRDRGILIRPTQDVVEAEIDLNEFGSDSSSSSADSATHRQFSAGAYPNQFAPTFPSTAIDMMNNSWRTEAIAPALNVDASPLFFEPSDFNGDYQPSISGTGIPPSRIKVRIDIGLLIAELVSHVVCLTRAPGVRLEDINKSIMKAAGLVGEF